MFYRSKHTIPESIGLFLQVWAAARSKDPNTKVAVVVYDPVSGGIFPGYNGFPADMPDLKELWDHRPRTPDGQPDLADLSGKYSRVIHAERNAVKKAVMALGENITRCVMYSTHYPCRVCMLDWVINFGIRSFFYLSQYPFDPTAAQLAEECGVRLEQFSAPEVRL